MINWVSLLSSLQALLPFYFFSGWVGRWGRLRAEEAPNWMNGSPNNSRVLDSTTVAVRPNGCHWCWAYQLIQLFLDDIWSSINHIWLDIFLRFTDCFWSAVRSTEYIQLPSGSVPSQTAGSTSRLSKDLAMPPNKQILCTGFMQVRNKKPIEQFGVTKFHVYFFFSGGSAVPRPARTDQVLSYNMKK